MDSPPSSIDRSLLLNPWSAIFASVLQELLESYRLTTITPPATFAASHVVPATPYLGTCETMSKQPRGSYCICKIRQRFE